MSDTLITAENLGKKFSRDLKLGLWYGLKDLGGDLLGGSEKNELREGEFWANRNLSFEVKRGECLGLIGHNGAGKTTLLKVLNGLIKPDEGQVALKGQVGALIALGAGFSQVLTGRENIYVNGSILGLGKKQIDAKLDEIIDFAELESAIDAPVRNLSSGMQVRLGFAVAAILIKPDILFLDEILAVGDAAFRAKCLGRIDSLLDQSAVILVSHNIENITRICTTGLCLEQGTALEQGDLSKVVSAYRSQSLAQSDTQSIEGIEDLQFSIQKEELALGQDVEITINLQLTQKQGIENCRLKAIVSMPTGEIAAECNTHNFHQEGFTLKPGSNTVTLKLPSVRLLPGQYMIKLAMFRGQLEQLFFSNNIGSFQISGTESGLQAYQMEGELIL